MQCGLANSVSDDLDGPKKSFENLKLHTHSKFAV